MHPADAPFHPTHSSRQHLQLTLPPASRMLPICTRAPTTPTHTWRVRLAQQAAAQEHQQLVRQPQALPPLQQRIRRRRCLSLGCCCCTCCMLCLGLAGSCWFCCACCPCRLLGLCGGSSRHQQQGGGRLVVSQRPGENGDQSGKQAVPDAQRDELQPAQRGQGRGELGLSENGAPHSTRVSLYPVQNPHLAQVQARDVHAASRIARTNDQTITRGLFNRIGHPHLVQV